MKKLIVLILTFVFCFNCEAQEKPYKILFRDIRGVSERSHEPLLRISPASQSGFDGVNPREVSNLVCPQNGSIPNEGGFSDAVWAWGQFVDHDIDLTHSSAENGTADILVLDPNDPLYPIIPFNRSNFVLVDGQREQINEITPFIDASNVYGSNVEISNFLRTFKNGEMKSANGLLPFNGQFLAGDVRANENLVLTSIHTLFVREHNRLAKLVSKNSPEASDEEIYQICRKIVAAEIQIITYNEFLPAVLGEFAPSLSDYRFDKRTDPAIATEFSTALFRVGHTMLSSEISLEDGSTLFLRDAFFNPFYLYQNPENVDLILAGLNNKPHQRIDPFIIDDVRNFLFGRPGMGGLDLASLNIQRGRDHNLPKYNIVRQSYGLSPVRDFSEITSDVNTQTALELAYGNVDEIDLWVGAISEDHVPGTQVGMLILTGLVDQFSRLRDGDPLFCVRDPDLKQPVVRKVINLGQVTFGTVIRNNTIVDVPNDVFLIER